MDDDAEERRERERELAAQRRRRRSEELDDVEEETVRHQDTELDLEGGQLRKTLVSKFTYQAGKMHMLSGAYESLDYDTIENDLLIEEEEVRGYRYILVKNVMKWVVFLLIGVGTAVVASTVDMTILEMTKVKNSYMTVYLDKNDYELSEIYAPWIAWAFLSAVPITIGSCLVTYWEPIAAGSGIPLVKSYLNGIDLPRVISLRTLFVKATGLCATIVGGVASGKEGPMIHIGACVANLMSKGRIKIGKKNIHLFRYFRDDQERRDFVSAGAASGVASAFGAPVGGVLFSLEESSSFWNQNLTWRMFFGSVVSTFTVNLILSAYNGAPGDLSHPSLINLGKMNFKYKIWEIPVFAFYGALGGLLGAFWNYLNLSLSKYRNRFIKRKCCKIVEVVFISVITSSIAFNMSFFLPFCVPKDNSTKLYSPRAFCDKDTDYNRIASMWLRTPQQTVNALLHDEPAMYPTPSLVIFTLSYFSLSCLTFGMSTSNGIFVPSLLTGAAWGRLLVKFAIYVFPALEHKVDHGKYAMIAAASQLGGLVRMTISLTVIIMETTNNIPFSLPIIVTLIFAKWTGDFFNDGIYMIAIKLKKAPFLPFDPPPLAHNIFATEVMNRPVVCLRMLEKVDFIVETIGHTKHNGYPVIENAQKDTTDDGLRTGKITGLILRSQLILILKNKWFVETSDKWRNKINIDTMRDSFLDEYSRKKLVLTFEDKECTVNLKTFMSNSPYTLLLNASLPKMFRLFRAIGLRHLPIVNDSNEVIGMVTRKDLAKYRYYIHRGRLHLQKLLVTD